ncbi:hypothetical protein [Candidatus Poriferisocius sp.]
MASSTSNRPTRQTGLTSCTAYDVEYQARGTALWTSTAADHPPPA